MKKSVKIKLTHIIVMVIIGIIGFSCGKNQAAPAGSSTQNQQASRTRSIWSVLQVKDEFGKETGDKVVVTADAIRGTFSNAVTTNSPLYVYILAWESDSIVLRFFEYSKDQSAILIEGSDVTVSIEDNAEDRHSIKGYTSGTNNDIYFTQAEGQKLTDVLKTGGNIKFRITISFFGTVTERYSFDLEKADGFSEALSEL